MADINYQHLGVYHLPTFEEEFKKSFSKQPRYNPGAIPDMLKLVDMIARDPNITDVRWGAYTLATVMWETTYPLQIDVPAKDKKGRPLMKNGQPVMVKQKKWLMTMAPVDEVGHGSGRRYHEPVKVAVLGDGSVRVTEQDGDQFSVSAAGAIKKLTRNAKMGTDDGGPAEKVYVDDPGAENAYYGRGYVQLTWWSNYVASGIAIKRGLDLLKDPELVKDPPTAYALMSHGLTTGEGFANGHKFTEYFSGQNRDYVGARRMVNGTDNAANIAKLAEMFEAILLESRITRERAARLPFIAY